MKLLNVVLFFDKLHFWNLKIINLSKNNYNYHSISNKAYNTNVGFVNSKIYYYIVIEAFICKISYTFFFDIFERKPFWVFLVLYIIILYLCAYMIGL